MRRRPERRDPVSMAGSLAIHGLVVFVAWWSTMSARPTANFITYHIDLVSPPPTVQAAEKTPAEKKLVVEAPESQPKEKKAAPVVPPKSPKRPPPKAKPKPTTAVAGKRNKAAAGPNASKGKKSESGEDIRVKMEGLRRDYPQYYNNIIVQMARCFRWQGSGNWSAIIDFVIRRDGSVTDIKVAQPSGNPVFDIDAMGAAECAGKGRLGALPKDLPYDRLPVRFRFTPSGGGGNPPNAAQEPENR